MSWPKPPPRKSKKACRPDNVVQGPWGFPTDIVGANTKPKEEIVNLPNGITLAGYALGMWWIAGGPNWAALASIVADEVDGRVARATKTATRFGDDLDWGSDLVLTALTLRKIGAPWWSIPAATTGQVWFRGQHGRPPLGSVRAVLMLFAVLKDERLKAAGVRPERGPTGRYLPR